MEDKKDYTASKLAKETERARFLEKIYNDTITALQTEERFVNFLASYHPASVEQFIRSYALMKKDWYEYGDSMKRGREYKKTWDYKNGIDALKGIMNKKLFDLCFRWALGEITIPGIEVFRELEDWQYKSILCPWLQPITQNEVDAYIAYLSQEDLDEHIRYDCYCPLTTILYRHKADKYKFEPDEDYNKWFRFYDRWFAQEQMLGKPIVRVAKENLYFDLYMKDTKEEREAYVKEFNAKRDMRPYLDCHNDEFRDNWVKEVENKEFQQLYKIYKRDQEENNWTWFLEHALILVLPEAKEPVPIQSNDDWRQAVKEAAEQFERKKTIEILPRVFEDYCKRIASGKDFTDWEKDKTRFHDPEYISKYKSWILRGRQLNGEPADFNF